MYPVKVLEACVKNCGAPMHKEVATKDMMDSFRELAKVDTVCSFLLYDFATTGLEIATKIYMYGEVTNLQLVVTFALSKQKG